MSLAYIQVDVGSTPTRRTRKVIVSLLDDMKAVEPGYNGINAWTILDEVENVEQVDNEFVGDSRWENFYVAVFKRNNEYVALHYSEPATELQEGQDQSTAEVYPVEPYEVTVTKYRKVK